jgi:predicted RNA-binding protein
MCDSSAYLFTEGQETLLLEHIAFFESKEDEIRLVNIFGEEKMVRAKIKRISLLDHKICFEPLLY